MVFAEVVEDVGMIVDGVGTGVIVAGALLATARCVLSARSQSGSDLYSDYRRRLGRAILLGLEFLVAADIIRTVAVDPSLGSVAVLAAVVVVRTFLSFALEVEISGRWPWQAPASEQPRAG